jgi:hypothetical protein
MHINLIPGNGGSLGPIDRIRGRREEASRGIRRRDSPGKSGPNGPSTSVVGPSIVKPVWILLVEQEPPEHPRVRQTGRKVRLELHKPNRIRKGPARIVFPFR